MRRNAVVSVFLRVLEFYSGILFLTTNKVGHFDEAFKSRIHVSLYYPALDKRSTLKIWKMNLDRLAKSKKSLEVEAKEVYEYARDHYKELHKKGKMTWNGRQIMNAFQTAIALAEFDANSRGRPVLTLEHFKIVAKAAEDFDDYLFNLHGGTDADLARRYMQRDDDPIDGKGQVSSFPYGMGGTRAKRKESSSSSSDSEGSDPKEKKRRKKEKKQKKKGGKAKAVALESSQSEESSSSETD